MHDLISGYRVRVDSVEKNEWYELLRRFDDANIYQTWAYEKVRHGRKNMSHFILEKEKEIVAAAQVRIARIPLIKSGVAYIRWGPLWRLHGQEADAEILKITVRGLRDEYVTKRGLTLKLRPLVFTDEHFPVQNILEEEGFSQGSKDEMQRTLVMDLGFSMDVLRKGLDKKWRRHLRIAEERGLEILEGYTDDLFETLMGLYEEMIERKRFPRPNDINEFREIQNMLPDEYKMKILLCLSGGIPSAGALCSTMGNTGMNIYRATNEVGRNNGASYLLQWRVIEWVRQRGCSFYNVNGINPELNPGTYTFKAGLCGRNKRDVRYIGVFDAYKSPFTAFWIKRVERIRLMIKRKGISSLFRSKRRRDTTPPNP